MTKQEFEAIKKYKRLCDRYRWENPEPFTDEEKAHLDEWTGIDVGSMLIAHVEKIESVMEMALRTLETESSERAWMTAADLRRLLNET